MNMQLMLGVEAVKEKLSRGGWFFLAGEEKLLAQLPKGDWVGGTTPYLMTEQGGSDSSGLIAVMQLPPYLSAAGIKVYDAASLRSVYTDSADNGFSFIVIPAGCKTHLSFALNAPKYEDFAFRPLIGWIAGVHLSMLGAASPRVFDGRSGKSYEDAAVVLHAALPRGKTANIGIINIFEPGDGDVLTFTEDGFSAAEVLVNGRRRGFAGYLEESKLDTRLPLVADYGGAAVNVSFQSVDAAANEVRFYAPVFKGVKYRHAKPVGDYLRSFLAQKPDAAGDRVVFSCNCILNYLYADLEGKPTAGFTGPITFGEVAYQLVNQTAVYLEISDTNLSERLRAETARQQRYRLLGTLMDTLPDPVFYKDIEGRYLGCNKAYEEFAGRPKEEILGRTASELFAGEMAAVFLAKDRELLWRAGRQTYELAVPAGAGMMKHLIFNTATFTASGGRVAGLIGAIADVTAQKLAAERLAAAYGDLKLAQDRLVQSEKMSAVGQLAAGVAHEINNPLGIILGFAQGLAKRLKADDPMGLPLRSIEREAVRCKNLVQDLLVFSRSSKLEEEELDLNEALLGALPLVSARAKTRGVEIVRELAPELPRIRANRNKLQQVLINLANNAIDAMPEGGSLFLATSLAAGRPGYVAIQVRDTGQGIPKAILTRVMEPFFTTKEAGKGTGLGLALVYETVQKHKGTVEVESEEGKGTKFSVFLPLVKSGRGDGGTYQI